MISQKTERNILLLSFIAGLAFAIIELIFSIYSHSQSALMDAVYDASELIFIALLLFLTPLFRKPISEKHPYGFFQVESVFLIIKGFMMIAVTVSVSATVFESLFSGGNIVNGAEIALFQFALGILSIIVFYIMKRMNRKVSSPTVDSELLGWKLDFAYSFGMAGAFWISTFLEKTSLAFIAPYFDSIMVAVVVLFMIPETIKMLWDAIKDVFLFSPDEETVDEIKEICNKIMGEKNFIPSFFDITRTGRHLWIAIYFTIPNDALYVNDLKSVSDKINAELALSSFNECTCELILKP